MAAGVPWRGSNPRQLGWRPLVIATVRLRREDHAFEFVGLDVQSVRPFVHVEKVALVGCGMPLDRIDAKVRIPCEPVGDEAVEDESAHDSGARTESEEFRAECRSEITQPGIRVARET